MISFVFLLKRTCTHLHLKETKNITHFLLLTVHPHWCYQCSFALETTLESSNDGIFL